MASRAASAPVPSVAERVRPDRPPDAVGAVPVEAERVDVEAGLVVGELVERAVERCLRGVVRDRHVRVVREVELAPGERAAAHLRGEPLALDQPHRDLDEHDRRHRAERARAAQEHANAVASPATFARWSSIASAAAASTSVGGSSVTCVGIAVASGSPQRSRAARSSSPYGSGMATATPIVGTAAG